MNNTKPTFCLEMPYIGTKGEQLLRALKKKLLRCLNISNLQVKTRVSTTKLNTFIRTPKTKYLVNKTSPTLYTSLHVLNVAAATLARLTKRFWKELIKEHAYKDKESAVYKHLDSCFDKLFLTSKTNTQLIELVLSNTKVVDSSKNWNLLLYKEALHIKRRKSILNNGLKASRKLQLFN